MSFGSEMSFGSKISFGSEISFGSKMSFGSGVSFGGKISFGPLNPNPKHQIPLISNSLNPNSLDLNSPEWLPFQISHHGGSTEVARNEGAGRAHSIYLKQAHTHPHTHTHTRTHIRPTSNKSSEPRACELEQYTQQKKQLHTTKERKVEGRRP